MIIDYIYLILILILICCILLLVYMSYEYRINEGINKGINKNINIEGFYSNDTSLTPLLDTDYSSKWDISLLGNQSQGILTNYSNYYTNAYNQQILKDNLYNIDLLKNANNNIIDSQTLVNLHNNLSMQKKTQVTKFPVNALINTIKSNYNSQYLSTFANDVSNYGVMVNDKCLSVNGLCKDEFCLLDCQNSLYTSDSQKFNTKRINNDRDASRVMNVNINKISNKNVYPFNIFTSVVNNNCLTIDNDGITVDKCNLNNIKQQWKISPNENICVLN